MNALELFFSPVVTGLLVGRSDGEQQKTLTERVKLLSYPCPDDNDHNRYREQPTTQSTFIYSSVKIVIFFKFL
jgi:hypothetical protein